MKNISKILKPLVYIGRLLEDHPSITVVPITLGAIWGLAYYEVNENFREIEETEAKTVFRTICYPSGKWGEPLYDAIVQSKRVDANFDGNEDEFMFTLKDGSTVVYTQSAPERTNYRNTYRLMSDDELTSYRMKTK